MKRSINLFVFAFMLAGSFMVLSAFTMDDYSNQGGVWTAPVTADKMDNPLKGDDGATSKGKKLYKQMCAICHGDAGKGDGMAGSSLSPRPANFTLANIQDQTDGAIYWKLTEGRAPMAAYKAILKDDQRWQLVNYIRTFKK